MEMDGTLRRRWAAGAGEEIGTGESIRAEHPLSRATVAVRIGIVAVALVLAGAAAIAAVSGDVPAGAASGEGWVTSAPGSYALDRGLSGPAEFTLEASRGTGGKDAQGRFTFDLGAGAFAFESTTCNSVSLSDRDLRMSGTGVVGGRGDYAFVLAAHDGESSDGLRLEVWDRATGALVYDNQPVVPRGHGRNTRVRAIGGGSIEIQESRAADSSASVAGEPAGGTRPRVLLRWR
ncbi:MAG: hypothetical protein ACYC5Q_02290 [Thermoleophilia bacterium]